MTQGVKKNLGHLSSKKVTKIIKISQEKSEKLLTKLK